MIDDDDCLDLLRQHQVEEELLLSGSTIWRRVKDDPEFPKPVRISKNRNAWVRAEVRDYKRKCMADREVGHDD